MVDALTNYCRLLPLKSKKKRDIYKTFFEGRFCVFGFPLEMHGDSEGGLVRKAMQQELKKYNIKFVSCGAHAHFENGIAE